VDLDVIFIKQFLEMFEHCRYYCKTFLRVVHRPSSRPT